MSAQHTPTPWKVIALPRQGWISIYGANNEEIVEVNQSDGCDEPTIYPDAENAAFIVRACNAHDDLVAAAKDAVEALKDASYKLVGHAPCPMFDVRREALEAALTKAEAANV